MNDTRAPVRLEFVPEGCGANYGRYCARISRDRCAERIDDRAHLHLIRMDAPHLEPLGVCSEGCAIALLEEDGLELVR
mgnify:FL=1